ncbi:hypothetical protein HPB50_022806 [Hyalomma asiaticum]|uniref:Uncharacterized protein n=1 Tax=Hyalomma asiaticum TaxID=266040 RepID=A0ACB7TPN9_HYAAI|nr:hypothetical protein HPB50_022806 [Hyalomma asiaticum]
MSRNSGDESGATNREGPGAQEGKSGGQVGGLTPERRLQELQAEMERLSQMVSRSSQRSTPELGRRDPCSELRRYSKVLSGVLPKFPTEAEAPVWFESVEMAERVPYLSTRLSPTHHRDYSVIKETVLDELKLSAGEYLKGFLGSGKRANEGWRPFATHLQSYLQFYLDAREVSTFEALEARRYITLQEGRKWVNASEMAAFLRTFEEAHGAYSAARQVSEKAVESQVSSGFKQSSQPGNCSGAKSLDINIRAVLDTGAEITVLRESAIPQGTVQPRGTVNLTSAFGERVQTKLVIVPLTMSRKGGVLAEVKERAWKLLNEEPAFHGVVKDAPGVGNPQLRREGDSSNAGTVQQQHAEASTCAHS